MLTVPNEEMPEELHLCKEKLCKIQSTQLLNIHTSYANGNRFKRAEECETNSKLHTKTGTVN